MTTDTLDLAPVDLTDARIKEPLDLAKRSRALTVTRDTKTDAEELILALSDAEKRVREVLDPICEQAHRAHKTATSKRATLLQPIDEARAYLRREVGKVQAALEAEAAEARRARQREAEAAERERLEREAEAIADEGDIEEAMDALEQADTVSVAPAAAEPVAKAQGIAYRDQWRPQWVDIKDRPCDEPDVRAIPREYLKVDETAIRRVVQAMKSRTSIPGVRAVCERVPVGTARR